MNGRPVVDPREARPVATARFELYWAFCLQYNPNSLILLIDVRDTYFQLNPFLNIAKVKSVDRSLYLFEVSKLTPVECAYILLM